MHNERKDVQKDDQKMNKIIKVGQDKIIILQIFTDKKVKQKDNKYLNWRRCLKMAEINKL